MAFGIPKMFAGFLLLLNFCLYVIMASIAGWALNKAIDHDYTTGPGGIPSGFPISSVIFPMGNEATGFLVIFALIAGVVGAGSCFTGPHHLRSWSAESLATAASSAMTAWALTLLAMGLACKEIHMHHRNAKLKTLELLTIILSGTQFLYMMVIHAGGRHLTTARADNEK
uniref:AWPM-19-like family protein n=1 Tax=Araucaria cunninghamii TaxID=56994 RepID=A0A0D6R068_ARACU